MSDEIRVDPMPDYARETLEYKRVAQLVGEAVQAIDDDVHREIFEAIVANQCRWTLTGPDEHGFFDVGVFYVGGDLLGRVRIHWSRLVPCRP